MCFQLKDEATTGTALTTLSASVQVRWNVKIFGGDKARTKDWDKGS